MQYRQVSDGLRLTCLQEIDSQIKQIKRRKRIISDGFSLIRLQEN